MVPKVRNGNGGVSRENPQNNPMTLSGGVPSGVLIKAKPELKLCGVGREIVGKFFVVEFNAEVEPKNLMKETRELFSVTYA